MYINYLILIPFIILNFLVISLFDKIKFFHKNIDKPDSIRKLHKKPIPLAGGIIIFINLLFYFFLILWNKKIFDEEILFFNQMDLILFILICSLIFLLGFVDDKRNLSASFKFVTTTILILFVLFFDENLNIDIIKFSFLSNDIELSHFSILFTCFCFLVFLNAFNMFDGINLQSCIYSIIILFSISLFYIDILLIKILIISLIGYSYLNYKNKSFLGDSGSLLISFIIGYIFIKIYNIELIEFTDEVVIYMLIPGLDLIRLFFKRIFLKRNPLSPDRFHLHHLLLLKFSNNKTLIILISLIIIPILSNFLQFEKIYIIILTIVFYSMVVKFVQKTGL